MHPGISPQTLQSSTESQRDVHENCNIQLEEQRNEISSLSARLKKAEDELRKKDDFLYTPVNDMSQVMKKTLSISKRLDMIFDKDKKIDNLNERNKKLRESLTKVLKSHTDLSMNESEMIISYILKCVRECSEPEITSSKLTDMPTLAKEKSERSNVNSNNLPEHILGFAFRIEKEFDDKDKVKKFGERLGLNICTVEKIVNEETGKAFWDVIHEWNKTSQSVAVLISACQRLSICPFSDGLMPPHHCTAIEKAYSRLAKNIFVEIVLVYLRDNAVLTPIDDDYILSPETKIEKFRRLVDTLPLFGDKAFDCLVEALTKSGQNHLAKVLTDELKKLTPVSDTLNREELEQTLQSEITTDDEFLSLNESDEADFDLSSFILILLLQLSLFILYKIW